ncbi:MAG: glycosyltransferase family 2 protein [Pedococcus sp.]
MSVVVPVYNPGPYIDPCIESLLGQTMSADDLELIFVDDGSTDDSLAKLQAVAAEHPQVTVIPIPNSGWPGKPRNTGADQARGDYVMFVDQDDTMEPEALERMHTLAAASGADVVLGKVISDFRGVNHEVYRTHRPSCTVFDAPLMESLTPHKMFRADFLREKGIRYPEGPRRLEDQLYMAKAYFAASAATVVGDYVCYRYLRRPDGGNAGSKRFDPAVYYGNLREVLDVVDAHTAPGEQRDHFYRRFLRVELLGRLGGGKVLKHPEDYFDALLREVRALLEERFPATVDAGMGAAMRVRAGIVRKGDREQILALAHQYNAVKVAAVLTGMRWAGSSFEVDVEVRLTHRGAPLVLEAGDGRLFLPRSVVGAACTDDERRVDDQLETAYGDVVLRHRELRDEWYLPQPLAVTLETSGAGQEVVWRGTATVDPATAAGGAPLRAGKQDFHLRLGAFGWARQQRLGAQRSGSHVVPDLLAEASGRLVERFDTDPHGNLSLNVAITKDRARTLLARTPVRSASRTQVELAPNVHLAQDGGRGTLGLRRGDGHRTSWSVATGGTSGGTTWVARAPDGESLRPGTYELTLSAPGPWGAVRLLEVVVVSVVGVSTRGATASPTTAERLTGLAARARRSMRARRSVRG